MRYVYKDANQNQSPENQRQTKIYIKEVTYNKNEESPEENKIRLRYITLNKIEGQEEGENAQNEETQGRLSIKEEKEQNIQEKEENANDNEMEGNEEENNEQNQINHEELDAQGKFNIQHSQENLAMQNQQQQATQSSGDDMHAQQFDHQDQDYEPEEEEQEHENKQQQEYDEEQEQEQLEQIEEHEEAHGNDTEEEHGNENEHVEAHDLNEGRIQEQNLQIKETNNAEMEHRQEEDKKIAKVSSVEEITGQSINMQGMAQASMGAQNINIAQRREVEQDKISDDSRRSSDLSNSISNKKSSPKSNNEIHIKAHIIEIQENQNEGGVKIPQYQKIRLSPLEQNQQVRQSPQSLNQQIKKSSEAQISQMRLSPDIQIHQAQQTQQKVGGKYPSLIQEYSKHLMTNPSDNYNNFATNKLNIIPFSANQNANLNINNRLSQEVQAEKQELNQNMNMLRKNIGLPGGIKVNEINQNRNPMMYSFGAKSQSSAGQNLSSSGNKNIYNVSENMNQRFNTEFVSSSFRNENANMQQQNDIRYAQRLRTSGEEIRTSGDGINMNVNNNSSGRVGINSQYTFGNNSGMSRVISNRSEVMSSERVMGDFGRGGNQFSQFDQFGQSGLNQRSGNYYYFSSTYNQSSSSMGASNALSREPMDGNPRNRKVYYESKRVDFSKLEIEPRDSRRK